MRWFMIYQTTSMLDDDKKIIRIHDIGDPMNVRIETQLGVLNFSDPNILAIVTEDHRHNVAKVLSEKLNMPIEGEHGPYQFDDPLNEVPDRAIHNMYKK